MKHWFHHAIHKAPINTWTREKMHFPSLKWKVHLSPIQAIIWEQSQNNRKIQVEFCSPGALIKLLPFSSYSYNYLLGYAECWTYLIVGINFSLSFMFFTKVVFWILWPNSCCLSLIWELPSWIDTSVYEIFLSLPIFDQHPRSVLVGICCFVSCFPTDETVDL